MEQSPRSAYLNRRYLACQISAIKFACIRQVRPFPRFSTVITASQPIRLGNFMTWIFKTGTSLRSAKKIAKCVHINRWQKSLVIFASDQIFRDRRIKRPGVSPALMQPWQRYCERLSLTRHQKFFGSFLPLHLPYLSQRHTWRDRGDVAVLKSHVINRST